MAFPTGTTGTSVLTTAIKPLYDADFMLTYEENNIWRQKDLVNWFPDMAGDGSRGSSIVKDVYDIIPPTTTALTELADKDPTSYSPGTITLTPDEYGDVAQVTAKAMTESYDNQKKVLAQLSGQQMSYSLDLLVRNCVLGGTWVERPNSNALRTGLDATSDKITYGFLAQVVARAKNQQIQPMGGDLFKGIVNPLLLPDIAQDTTWLATAEYQDKENIYKGEAGALAGIGFIAHRYGKLYLGGGTVAQTATTVATSNVAAGDTTLVVASATGLAAGDYLTLGTLEAADSEQVFVTVVASTTITFRGIGNAPGNFGCAFPHAVGAAVTEAPNVAAIPILGRNSLFGVSSAQYGGKMGSHGLDWKPTNIPERFLNAWWKAFLGFQIYEKHVIRAEVALSTSTIDRNY